MSQDQQFPEAKIFSCSNSRHLAEIIAKEYGIPLGNSTFSVYSDGEFQPSYEESIRGLRVFIVCSTFPNADKIMAEGFLLGAHHGMTIEDVDYVCNKIKEYIMIKIF